MLQVDAALVDDAVAIKQELVTEAWSNAVGATPQSRMAMRSPKIEPDCRRGDPRSDRAYRLLPMAAAQPVEFA